MSTTYEERFTVHPEDFKKYTTEEIRKHFLIENLFEADKIKLTYSHYDRYIAGGCIPKSSGVKLETIDPLKADYFLERREMGIINIGGDGEVVADGESYELSFKDALYIGKETKEVEFKSKDKSKPAKFYINSAPAHRKNPNKLVKLADAEIMELGSLETANARKINKLLVNSIVDTCQLQMGVTELQTGSVWNTMPPHTHTRRMEIYLYIDLPEDQTVCHFMGQPHETRHIFMQNEQAAISPNWSIHSGSGTRNYSFIWGMAGENLDYADMDGVTPTQLR